MMIYRSFGTYRAVLAFLVIPQHIGSPVLTGTAAVYAFFALSGYIITEVMEQTYRGRAAAFVVNRALRIGVPFLAALGMAICATAFAGGGDFSIDNIAANVFALLPGIQPSQSFMPYAWAIQVEIMFYGAMTIAAIFGAPLLPFAALGFVVYVATGELGVLAYAPYFAFGVMCAHRRWFMATIALLAGLAVAPGLFDGNALGGLTKSQSAAHTVLLAIMLMAIPILGGARLPERYTAADKLLGNLSYPIYLTQHAAIVAISATALEGATHVAAVFAATIALALALDVMVERPLALLRRKVRDGGHCSADHVIGGTGRREIRQRS